MLLVAADLVNPESSSRLREASKTKLWATYLKSMIQFHPPPTRSQVVSQHMDVTLPSCGTLNVRDWYKLDYQTG